MCVNPVLKFIKSGPIKFIQEAVSNSCYDISLLSLSSVNCGKSSLNSYQLAL